MSTPKHSVLFLCTGNSARSILAEALLNEMGKGRFQAYSAGSAPKGNIHPMALHVLQRQHFNTESFYSKSWDEFATASAPSLDFVFTLCDSARQETCPVWPGQPMTAHWGLPDPAAVKGNDAEIAATFNETMRMLSNRLSLFVELPIESLDKLRLQEKIEEIGQSRS
ncbi:MAG: arsenate reductase ArsC [Pseudomonadota bacterium]